MSTFLVRWVVVPGVGLLWPWFWTLPAPPTAGRMLRLLLEMPAMFQPQELSPQAGPSLSLLSAPILPWVYLLH